MNKENTQICCAASRNSSGPAKTEPMIEKSGTDSNEKMIELKGGKFLMGTDDEEGFGGDGCLGIAVLCICSLLFLILCLFAIEI